MSTDILLPTAEVRREVMFTQACVCVELRGGGGGEVPQPGPSPSRGGGGTPSFLGGAPSFPKGVRYPILPNRGYPHPADGKGVPTCDGGYPIQGRSPPPPPRGR